MDQMIFPILGAIVVAYILSRILGPKIAQGVYNQTGYNGFTGLHRAIAACILILPLVAMFFLNDMQYVPLCVAIAIIPVVILVLMNLKAKIPCAGGHPGSPAHFTMESCRGDPAWSPVCIDYCRCACL